MVPGVVPEDLYDLILKTDTDSQTCHRCVKVVADYSEEFYFIHISDVHITFPIIADSMDGDNPNALFERLAEEINIINPAFVLITGDVTMSTEGITRLLFQKGMTLGQFVQERMKLLVKEEFDAFLEILNRFRVPTFVIPGNHDMVGTVNKVAMENWQDTMGRRYFSFDFGGAHFSGFDNSAQFEMAKMIYDTHPDFTEIDKEQLDWLEEDLKNNQDKKIIVLFYHVPYTKQDKTAVTELAGRYGVKLALAGHLHDDSAMRYGDAQTSWVRTASNLDFGAYRVIRVRGDEIVSWGYDKPLPEHTKQKPDAAFAKYAFAKTPEDAGQVYSMRAYNFDVKYAPANDGTASEVTATITNKTPETFENALLRFYMQKAEDYSVSGGKLVQIVEGKDFNLCYVSVNIAPNSEQTVSIIKK
ncbi:MAG: metallophosphoesterase [bacterium]